MTIFEKMNTQTIDERAEFMAVLMLASSIKLLFPDFEEESVKEWANYNETVQLIKEMLQKEAD
jgi:hypothetical protein